MKAVVVRAFGAPEVLKIEDAADPVAGAGQVVVAVKAVGVNPVETYIRSGSYARKPALPYTPGGDAGGVVEAVGAGVTGVKPGDRVWTSGSLSGTYAERALCREADVHPLPARVSFAQGAALGVPFMTAYHALLQVGRARKGETVLVHGASGGVGIASIQLAKGAGCTVLGTAGTEAGRKLATAQGAHQVLDHGAAGFREAVMAATNGRGVDLILEMLANVNLGKDLELLAPRGRVAVIGSRGCVEVNPRDLMAREASIHGVMLGMTGDEDRAAIQAALAIGLENGTLVPVIGREIPLAQAPAAHEAVMAPGHLGKIVLIP
ncbi:MAG: NADPH:quinone reductase [Candidatus Coatesbacteria bacterium]